MTTPQMVAPPVAAAAPPIVAAASPPPVALDPVLALTPDQHDFLAGMPKIALAVNDPAGAPHITTSIYRWDGTTLHLPAQQFTLRASNVERDPRVSLLVEDAASEASVAVTGVAAVLYGDQVEAEMLLLLAKYLAEDDVVRRWEEMRASADRMIIQVRPTRFVWRSA